MHCATLRLHDIKKLTSMSLEYNMEVHLADAYILGTVDKKNFGFLSRPCLLREGGGQVKSAKNCQFPYENMLF